MDNGPASLENLPSLSPDPLSSVKVEEEAGLGSLMKAMENLGIKSSVKQEHNEEEMTASAPGASQAREMTPVNQASVLNKDVISAASQSTNEVIFDSPSLTNGEKVFAGEKEVNVVLTGFIK